MRYTVFCGSSSGTKDVFFDQAFLLGEYLAKQNIGLVYGGAKVGLMGAVADGVLKYDGEVIGVLPTFLGDVELGHSGLTELILVETMHERKAKMDELSDGTIAMPGGYGTLEEFFEMLTWAQLGLHKKPVALLNIDGFYNPLLQMVDNMVSYGFLKQVNRDMIVVADNIEELLEKMRAYKAPKEGKWIKKER
ncbi:MAG: TIGR00730 family Rossman fold protein [Myroides sp.]|uniref:Cytokinin riboside 5'-monophosphate phosphoribohydrolase n=1 Tax=Myroides marinus TaxID=703342 RepID=A0A161S514_9FLAO|nr:TIGR00730 family Rossman fold protein [Myroides marinus]KUF44030.1 LOG family protein YvdD [Myroides marinus]KZE79809.1 LOG family protein YvdD [Myroides marinus]MDR0194270.1 TIGR00730 family Rossman fold protein [Myroides sp.]